ncbi:MAG: carboxypeptidase regulatory-like domain-containing protein [Candidatus Anammoxibacter sp.]
MYTVKIVDLPCLFRRLIIFISVVGLPAFFGLNATVTNAATELPLVQPINSELSKYNPSAIIKRYIQQIQNVNQNSKVDAFATVRGSGASLLWEKSIDEGVLFSPVINKDRTVAYIASNEVDTQAKDFNGRLYAINLVDGTEQWTFDVDGLLTAGPIVAEEDGTIYVVAGSAPDQNVIDSTAVLFAVNDKGKKKWSFKVEGSIVSAPVLSQDGRIFFGTTGDDGSGVLYAINPLSVSDTDNVKPDWTFKTKGAIVSSPLVTERGTVFVASTEFADSAEDDDVVHMTALGIDEGNLKWEFEKMGAAFVSPVRKGSIVLYGVSNINGNVNKAVVTGEIIAFDTDKIDPRNVEPSWSRIVNGGIFFTPLLLTDTLYLGTIAIMTEIPASLSDLDKLELPTGSLIAIDIENGDVRWSVDLDSIPVSSPVVGPEGSILITSDEIILGATLPGTSLSSRLFAVTSDGNVKFSATFENSVVLSAPVADIDGVIYIGLTTFSLRRGFNGKLGAVEFESGETKLNFNVTVDEPILSSPIVDLNRLTNEKTVYFGTTKFMAGLLKEELDLSGAIYAISATRKITQQESSTITIDEITPSASILGTPVTVKGNISPTPNGEVIVEITIANRQGSMFSEEVFTNSSGQFTLLDALVPGGNWEVAAEWQGDSTLFGASSDPPESLIVNPAETSLTLDVPSTQLVTGDVFDVTGTIKPDPDSAFARDLLVGRPIELIRIDPNDEIDSILIDTEIVENVVQFKKNDARLVQPGKWKIIATFDENNANFNKSNLEEREITVTAKAVDVPGYVVLVQGKLDSGDGLDSYNLSTKLIRKQFISCGFKDDDIFYFNFDISRDGVDGVPTENSIVDAITRSVRDKMNLAPAPLYVVFVGPGEEDRLFLSPDSLTSDRLAQALDDLAGSLNESASDQKIIVVIGAPHSGSFIDELSGDNRIVITSSDTREVPFKGLTLPDRNIANGDFFVSEFFKHASTGLSIKNSYENAAQAAKTLSRNRNGNGLNGADAGNGSFEDDAAFHPLLDDNGDNIGTNGQLSAITGKDGALAANIVLCVDVDNSSNVEITEVTSFLTLEPDDPDPLLTATVSNITSVGEVGIAIKDPGFELIIDEESTEQIELDLRLRQGTFDTLTEEFNWQFSGLDLSGKFQIFYIAEDIVTADISIFDKTTTIIRNNDPSITPPAPFEQILPVKGQNTSVGLSFTWEPTQNGSNNQGTVSADKKSRFNLTEGEDAVVSDVKFNLLISRDETFNSVDFQLDDISENFAIVDTTASLEFDTSYFWKVVATEENGAFRSVSDGRSFSTTISAGFPGFVKGVVKEKDSGSPILNAIVKLLDVNESFTTQDDGAYFFELPSGDYTIEVEKPKFNRLKAAIAVASFETTSRELLLEAKVASADDNILTVTPETAGKSFRLKNKAVVTLLDPDGNPVSGVTIDATASGKFAKVTPSSQTTNSDGKAEFKFKFGFRTKNGSITFSSGSLSALIVRE